MVILGRDLGHPSARKTIQTRSRAKYGTGLYEFYYDWIKWKKRLGPFRNDLRMRQELEEERRGADDS